MRWEIHLKDCRLNLASQYDLVKLADLLNVFPVVGYYLLEESFKYQHLYYKHCRLLHKQGHDLDHS